MDMDLGEDQGASLNCNICGQHFNKRNSMIQHRRKKHPSVVKKYANLSEYSPEERRQRARAQGREAVKRYRARKEAENDQVRVIHRQSPRVLI